MERYLNLLGGGRFPSPAALPVCGRGLELTCHCSVSHNHFMLAFQPFFYANVGEEALLVEALSCVKAERGPA